jgi:flavin reductase (DIM6/NTAB) family NADH-FMN oxidoreductase RutF
MRKMPHAVVVATTSIGASSSNPSFRGMTVSSFTTLTLTPTPIITFNIRRPSRTLDAIRESRQFLIHILSATESGAKVAHSFTQGNAGDVFASQKFAVWNVGSGCPLPLLSAPGVTKVLRCTLRNEGPGQGLIEVGDHVLVLADVQSIIEPPPSQDKAMLEQRGLSYLDRAYREVGEVIEHVDRKEDDALE